MMSDATLPSPPPRHSDDWAMRNWKWLVAMGCLVFTAVAFGFVHFILGVLKTSEPYTTAVACAQGSPAVVAALGAPISEKYWVSGSIQWHGTTGSAQLAIPIAGPNGEATIHVAGSKSGAEWHYERLIVQLQKTNEQIVLSATSKPAATSNPGRR